MGGMNIVRGRRDKQREREDGGRKGEKEEGETEGKKKQPKILKQHY